MDPVKVQKKDGSLEDFNRNKVLNGIIKSGALPEVSESVTTQVEQWAKMSASNGVVTSLDIRGKVLEFLRQQDADSATRYESYQKPPVAPETPTV